MQVAYGLYRHQPMKITYCSCETRAVEKLTRYHTRIRNIPTEGPRIVFHDYQLNSYHYLQSAHMFPDNHPQSRQFWKWLRRQHAEDELFVHSILWTDAGFRREVCIISTTVVSGHGIILVLSPNVGIKSNSSSAFGLVRSGTLSWAPNCYLTCSLLCTHISIQRSRLIITLIKVIFEITLNEIVLTN
jgi:hypothetical protein